MGRQKLLYTQEDIERMKELRKQKVKFKDIAAMFGTTAPTISLYVSGQRNSLNRIKMLITETEEAIRLLEMGYKTKDLAHRFNVTTDTIHKRIKHYKQRTGDFAVLLNK